VGSNPTSPINFGSHLELGSAERFIGRMAIDEREQIGRNVLGTKLQCCCSDPITGYFRDGYCRTDATDIGQHFVCAEMTDAFLEFSMSRGNDLVTARPEFDFPGLKAGDRWCLCIERWLEAWEADCAPPVILEATYAGTLEYVSLSELQAHAKPLD
jgi:uncharacterized protein